LRREFSVHYRPGKKIAFKKTMRVEAGSRIGRKAHLQMREMHQSDCAFQARAEDEFFLKNLSELDPAIQPGAEKRGF
jgi:hypothetical protein